MTSTPNQTSLIERMTKHLPAIEKLLLIALVIGSILMVMHLDLIVLEVALFGLAITFFLSAYRQTEIPVQENEQLGFAELLALMIIPKVIWISSAVSTLGIAFYLFI